MHHLQGGRLDLDDGCFHGDDGAVERLTDLERRLLRHLAERGGAAVSREELQREVWGYRAGILSRTVFTTVSRVRVKIERDPARPEHLLTAAGGGYCFVGAAPAERPLPPAARSPIVGRDHEIRSVEALISGDASLVTLMGPGGIGKTRLAAELARRWGAPFVALEPVDAVDRVPHMIAAACGVALGGADPWGELAALDLPPRVVLDNLEHLPALGARLAGWLAGAPATRVVATSRVRLGVQLEHAVVVPPLSMPTASLQGSDAGSFLLGQARRARPGWEPSPDQERALIELCRRVGGSPLALELAAAWLRLLDPAELLAELDAVLSTTDVDRPARHRSVAEALEASWRLLAPPAARALEALSVFCEPFDRAAAATVAGADLMALGQLVDASMVVRADGSGAARFDLHPLIRQDARRRLAADPARRRAVADAHAARWVAATVDATARFDRGAAVAPLPLEDVLAAWAHLAATGDADALARAGYPLYRLLDHHNRLPDLFVALDHAAALPPGPVRDALASLRAGAGAPLDHPSSAFDVPEPLRTAALVHAAISRMQLGDLAGAVALADAGLAGAQALDNPFLQGFARSVRASARMRAGDLDAARVDLEAAMRSNPSGRGLARPYVHLGEVALAAGDAALARGHLEGALAVCRSCADPTFAALALCRLGQARHALREDPEAVWVEAIEEGVASRLPRVWWGSALVGLGARWRGHDGVLLVVAATQGPLFDPPDRVAEVLAALRGEVGERGFAEAEAAGRVETDAALLARVRSR